MGDLISYENFYGINETTAPGKYAIMVQVRFRDIPDWLAGAEEGSEFSGMTFEKQAVDYLLRAGMTETEIGTLTRYLCGE